MSYADRLSLRLRRRLPVILQTEATECGLACLAMVAAYHGYKTDLATLRQRFPISLMGARLTAIEDIAHRLQLATRAVRAELDQLSLLRLPAIVHWNSQHFVVLTSVSRRRVTIVDPARGERDLAIAEVSRAFNGVALELWPNPGFEPREEKPRIRAREMMGHVTGLRRSIAQVLLLTLSLQLFSIVGPLFMQFVVDNVVVAADRNLLTILALAFGCLTVVQQLITSLRAWVVLYLSSSLNIQWRANVFTHLLRLPGQYFEKRHVGDIVSRFNSVEVIQRALTTSLVEGILDGLMVIAMTAMLFLYAPVLSWITIAAVVLYALGRWIWYRPLRSASEEQIIHAAKQSSHFLETLRGVKAIKLFQGLETRRASWLVCLADQVNAGIRMQRLQIFFTLMNGLLFGIANIATIWVGARLVLDGQFSIGMMTAFLTYKGQFVSRVTSVIDRLVGWKMIQLECERLADIVRTKAEDSGAEPPTAKSGERLEATVEARNVSFRYAEHEPHILANLNLEVAAGEAVAITGPSGCGKTTLVNLLLGMLVPTVGEVLIGGRSLRGQNLDALRSRIGVVSQDDALFQGSIADNIAFFDSKVDQARVEECARVAAIHDDIALMPMGYNTLVGYMGSILSGGQKQRVLIARALYKRPAILILDEATSHLDGAAEKLVNRSLRTLGVTRIIVAHRPQTIASADRVVVMAAGKIVSVRHPETAPGESVPALLPRVADELVRIEGT